MPSPTDPIQIPLAVDLEARLDISFSHQDTGTKQTPTSFILNGFIEENKANNTKYVVRRNGYDVIYASGVATTAVMGFYYIQDLDQPVMLVSVSGTHYLEYNSATYALGASAPIYDMTYIESGGKYYIFIVGALSTTTGKAGYAWVFEPATTTLTQLVVGTHGFPNTTKYMTRGAVSLDNYAFVLTTDGELYNSNVGDILTWTSTDFLQTDDAEDKKVYMCKHYDHIAVLGTNKITFYYDAGNPSGSPLALRKDLTIPRGVLSYRAGTASTDLPYTWSCANDDEYIGFIGASKFSDTTSSLLDNIEGVYLIKNFNVQKISTPYIDNILSNFYGAGVSFHLSLHLIRGRKLLIISSASRFFTSPNAGDLVYDITTGYWYLWALGTEFNLGVKFASGEFIVDYNYGAISKYSAISLKDEVYDNITTTTVEFPFTIQTPQLSLGTSNNKLCRTTTILGDYSDAAQAVGISWTDDNYQNFSSAREIDLQSYRKLTRCGIFRKRAWKISRQSTNTGTAGPVRLSHIEIKVDPSTVNTAD